MSDDITLEEARELAVRKYPGAAPLADLITGNTVEEVFAMAAEVEARTLQAEVTEDAEPEGPFSGLGPAQDRTVTPTYVEPDGLSTEQERWDRFFDGVREASE